MKRLKTPLVEKLVLFSEISQPDRSLSTFYERSFVEFYFVGEVGVVVSVRLQRNSIEIILEYSDA